MPEFSYIELACRMLDVDPDSILSFHEYDDQLAIITAEGKKFVFTFEELESKSVPNIAAANKLSERAPMPANPGGVGAASIEKGGAARNAKNSSARPQTPAPTVGVGSRSRRGTGPPYIQSGRAPMPVRAGEGAAAVAEGQDPMPAQTGGVGSRSKRGTGLHYFQSGRVPTPIQTTEKDAAIEKEPRPADDSDPAAQAARRRKIRRPKAPNVSQEGPQEK